MKKHIIYKRTFPNGKVYIGQTGQDIQKYTEQMYANAFNKNIKNYNRLYYRAIRKYKDKGIGTEILYSNIDTDCIDDLETLMISTYNANNPQFGYNSQSGGSLYKEVSIQTRKKMSQSQKGKKIPIQSIIKRTQSRKGLKMSDYTKDRIKQAVKGVYKFIPEYQMNQFMIWQKVIPKRFNKWNQISPWHEQCERMATQIKNKNRVRIVNGDKQ